MKDSIEKHFKDILGEHELPFSPDAWDQLSDKLDVVMPTSKSKNNWKWYLGGAVIIISISGLLWKFTWNNAAYSPSSETLANLKNRISEKTLETNNIPKVEIRQKRILSEKYHALKPQEIFSSSEAKISKNEVVSVAEYEANISNQRFSTEQGFETNIQSNNLDPVENTPSNNIVYPVVKDLCEGERVWIKNENLTDIFLTDYSRVYQIGAGKILNFAGESAGSYYFGHIINHKVEYSNKPDFKVKESVKADFTINDEVKYEYGIPTTSFSANSEGSLNYSWSIEGSKIELTGKEVKTHFYRKGIYDVTLTVEPKDQRCPTTVKKQVTIQDDYNLLAVNSFLPNSPNPKNATFMPYALKERNADFTMRIIDPANGATLFETNEATNGWNGINRSTGQLVDANKAFIWIVRINNPLPDEKSEYKGTIVRLP